MEDLTGGNLVVLLLALFVILSIYLASEVPQSDTFVVERFGRLRAVLGPGLNFIVPFLDRVAHRISILERQLPTASQHHCRQRPPAGQDVRLLPHHRAGEDRLSHPRHRRGHLDPDGGHRALGDRRDGARSCSVEPCGADPESPRLPRRRLMIDPAARLLFIRASERNM
jgi:hypothetical protein